jgi:hypothetical protein
MNDARTERDQGSVRFALLNDTLPAPAPVRYAFG